jgi:cysteine desulfurase
MALGVAAACSTTLPRLFCGCGVGAAVASPSRRGWQRQLLPVDRRGLVDLEVLQDLLQPPTRLVSILWGQSEVGTLQPIASIGRFCRQAGVLLHVDAVQVEIGRASCRERV